MPYGSSIQLLPKVQADPVSNVVVERDIRKSYADCSDQLETYDSGLSGMWVGPMIVTGVMVWFFIFRIVFSWL